MTNEEVQALQTELETTKTELETAKNQANELTGQLGERDAKLGVIQGQLTEFTELGKTKDEKLQAAETATGELTAKLEAATGGLASAFTSYKALVLQANPTVPGELITGESIEELNESLEKAKAVVGKVREGLAAEAAAVKVPAGAPPRTLPDLSALSPREKLEYAVKQGGKK